MSFVRHCSSWYASVRVLRMLALISALGTVNQRNVFFSLLINPMYVYKLQTTHFSMYMNIDMVCMVDMLIAHEFSVRLFSSFFLDDNQRH